MTMGSERSAPSPLPAPSASRPLHNFNLLGLRWGNQAHLRCMKASDGRAHGYPNASDVIRKRKNFDESPADIRRGSDFRLKSGSSYSKSRFPPLPPTSTECSRKIRRPPETWDDGNGIAAVREKLMMDLQTETDRIKVAIFKEGLDDTEAPPEIGPPFLPPAPAAASSDTRPWNLRLRRAACKAPSTSNGITGTSPVKAPSTSNGIGGTSPVKAPVSESAKPYSSLLPPRLRSGVISTATTTSPPGNEKDERPKFSVALSRREIEEDIFAITGRKPHRRPQKRPRNVQKTLDTLFPGLWLTEINADMYKVPKTQ